tara:strand:- start:422 stop:1018 length:597 start_codon:yes stop_codon:yes gene_type:complete
MFALVKDGSIVKMLSGNQGVTVDDIQHPKAIFTLWTKDERESIGVYEVEMDTSKFKDQKWYINTNVTYSFGSGKVTGSYGDATARAHADTKWTAQDESDGKGTEGEVATEGLKTVLIRDVKKQAESELGKTDWYVTRKSEKSTSIPSAVTTHRDAVRSKQSSMETAITNASDTPALETLYTRNSEGVRPLGDIPKKDF